MKSRNLSKHYTPRFKFQVVLEVLKAEKTMGQLAKAYGVHPVTLSHWKGEFLEKGPDVLLVPLPENQRTRWSEKLRSDSLLG